MGDTAVKDLAHKIKEAEAYCKHGLFAEAVQIFEHLLENEDIDNDTSKFIVQRIKEIQKDIEEVEKIDQQILSSQQANQLADTWKGKGTVPEIIDSAEAFDELGLSEEAASEYGKLLSMNCDFDEFSSKFSDFMFARFNPSNIYDQLAKILKTNKVTENIKAQVLFFFGEAFEKKNNSEVALEYFEKVKSIDPSYPHLKDKLLKFKKKNKYNSKFDYLIEKNLIDSSKLKEARDISKNENKSVEFVLTTKMKISKEEIGKSLSCFYNVPFKTFNPQAKPPVGYIQNLKKNFLIQNMWVPIDWDIKKGIDVIIDDPLNLMKTDQIASLLDVKKINYFVSFPEDIKAYIKLFYEQQESLEDKQDEAGADNLDQFSVSGSFELEEEEEDEIQSLGGTESEVVRMVDQIIFSAYKKDASDIHIEPSPGLKKTKIRYRVDGVCQQVLQVPNSFAAGIISRLKVMANLDIAEKRLPQDGKIKFKRKGIKEFELRLATLPTAGGFEDAVLRILAASGAMSIDDMGMNRRNLELMKKIIVQPYGLFLVVGPTGSGKTTTLHSALAHINKPGIKIWTAEDPVEITQEGLRQVECKPKIGLDFARVMRSFLRADPDVIMIGEMRDHETAAIGIEASLTGHMVFSTLHTNSAPETVTRLLDMGLNPLNFSDAFLGVLAQRLVRRLCKHCKEEYTPDEEKIDEIIQLYGGIEKFEKISGRSLDELRKIKLYRAKGCDECSEGYRGRLGIHELMAGTPNVKKLIKKKASTEEIFSAASEEGMKTLVQDGLDKVFQGLTDVGEIKRVCVN
ncbi:MAG: ATPase, T2SS/T4P/T4SS family [Desulforegulaceae bacterium]|nr:ATPase, T2SS/T4P/T4SS family [Desulforegulaceae bacterium]